MSRADCDVCDEYHEKELAELHKQIAALKAALICERELRIVGSKESKCYPHIGTWKQCDKYSRDEATSQLARDLPTFDWGDVK